MKIVFDSNVWIAALAASGTSKDVVEEALGRDDVFISPYILKEVDRALEKKIGASAQERFRVRQWLLNVCHCTEPPPQPQVVCRDPKDKPILELAWAVRAHLLVTGDKDLLILRELKGTEIIPPAAYWKRISH